MAIGDRKKRRIRLIALGGVALATATVLGALAFNDAIVFFFPPEKLLAKAAAGEIEPEQRLRLGGLVAEGSVATTDDGGVRFKVSDGAATVPVTFKGVLPDLFREGQGVVAVGFYRNGAFEAEEILAKHDEKYMPPEVAEALKKSGQWKPEAGGPGSVDGGS